MCLDLYTNILKKFGAYTNFLKTFGPLVSNSLTNFFNIDGVVDVIQQARSTVKYFICISCKLDFIKNPSMLIKFVREVKTRNCNNNYYIT